jgi:predicted peroxiredoxin
MDLEAVVVLQSDGVWLAQKGYAERISVPGFVPLKQLVDSYVANGGKLLT